MANPFIDLQNQLLESSTVSGKVIAVLRNTVHVATYMGLMQVSAYPSASIGDSVTVRDGRAIKNQETVKAPVFFV